MKPSEGRSYHAIGVLDGVQRIPRAMMLGVFRPGDGVAGAIVAGSAYGVTRKSREY